MDINQALQEYQAAIQAGWLSQAYQGILTVMQTCRHRMMKAYPTYSISSIYPGQLDITYFTFTHPTLATYQLKVVLVYQHPTNQFMAWLVGRNRQIQDTYINKLQKFPPANYQILDIQAKVDAIIKIVIQEQADFSKRDVLLQNLLASMLEFNQEMLRIITAIDQIE